MATARALKTHPVTVRRAATFWSRLLGLMLLPHLPPAQGLLLTPCRSVHTCFMRFALDVVFLDADLRVVAVVERLPPWRFTQRQPRARHALELAAGEAERLSLRCGDAVSLQDSEPRRRILR